MKLLRTLLLAAIAAGILSAAAHLAGLIRLSPSFVIAYVALSVATSVPVIALWTRLVLGKPSELDLHDYLREQFRPPRWAILVAAGTILPAFALLSLEDFGLLPQLANSRSEHDVLGLAAPIAISAAYCSFVLLLLLGSKPPAA